MLKENLSDAIQLRLANRVLVSIQESWTIIKIEEVYLMNYGFVVHVFDSVPELSVVPKTCPT